MRRVRSALICLVWLALPVTTFAQDQTDLDKLTRAEAEARETEKALAAQEQAIRAELDQLKTQLQEQSTQTQAYEREGQRLEAQVSELTTRIADLQAQLLDNRDSLQGVLAALQRLERAPSAALTATPDDAIRTAQTARLIQTLTEDLQVRADRIARLSADLMASRDTVAERRSELTDNQQELDRRRTATASLLATKEALQARLMTDRDAARAEAERLAAEASTLRELLERLRDKAARITPRIKPRPGGGGPPLPLSLPDDTRPFAQAKGALVKPVSGAISKAFGRGEQGQTYTAPSEGQVVAPYTGRVEFAGAFKNHGRIVILNMDGGYYMLLTGLGQTFVDVEEIVKRGEPIGTMPSRAGGTTLYLEIRLDGRSIDPSPWLS